MAEIKPLKGKKITIAEEIYNEKTGKNDLKFVSIFVAKDVKSAIQGLLQEIRKEEREREICAYNVADYDEGGARFQSGFASGLRHAQYLIKRWFPDVFEDENEKE